jgi:hypothetical protein
MQLVPPAWRQAADPERLGRNLALPRAALIGICALGDSASAACATKSDFDVLSCAL